MNLWSPLRAPSDCASAPRLETLDRHAQRVAKFNPRLNVVVALDLETAHARARAADAALARGESWGPLHGVPFALKDCHEVAGFPSTVGSQMFAGYGRRTTAR